MDVINQMRVINLERRRRILAAILIDLLPQKHRKRRWIRPIDQQRDQPGFLIQEMRLNNEESHYVFFQMGREHFNKLLTLVGPQIQRQTANYQQPISPSQRLAITLRFLATGESYSSIALMFRCGRTAVGQIVLETAVALWDILWPTYMPVPNREMWKRISGDIWEKWQFPMCIGAMDGKYVYVQDSSNADSMSYNYKDSNSIVLFALCDADYKYIIVDIGKQSDGGCFGDSSFGEALIAGNVDLPSASNIPGTSITVPPVAVADEAFPLLQNLMRPFPKRSITKAETIFNRRLSRVRQISENVLGISCAKWRVMLSSLYMHPDNAEAIVKCICALHNYVRVEESAMEPERRRYCPDGYMDMEDRKGTVVPGRWRQEVCKHCVNGLGRQGANTYSKIASQTRDIYVKYFLSNEGKEQFLEQTSPLYSGF